MQRPGRIALIGEKKRYSKDSDIEYKQYREYCRDLRKANLATEIKARKILKAHHKIVHRAWNQKVSVQSWHHCCMTVGPSELNSLICQLELSTLASNHHCEY